MLPWLAELPHGLAAVESGRPARRLRWSGGELSLQTRRQGASSIGRGAAKLRW